MTAAKRHAHAMLMHGPAAHLLATMMASPRRKGEKRQSRRFPRLFLAIFTVTIVGCFWFFILQTTNLETEVLRAIAADNNKQPPQGAAKQGADAQVNSARPLSKANATSNLRREQVVCGGHSAPSCQECPQVRLRWRQHSGIQSPLLVGKGVLIQHSVSIVCILHTVRPMAVIYNGLFLHILL